MRLALWLAAAGAAGLVVGVAWPPPPIPASQQAAAGWALPTPAELERHSKDGFQQAKRGTRWVGEENDAGSQAGPVPWRLAGILALPAPTALVLREGKPTKAEQVQIGGALPDGYRLREIGRNQVVAELEGCRIVYELYRQSSAKADDCPARTGQAEQ